MQSSIEEKRESIRQTLKQLESRETLSQEDYDGGDCRCGESRADFGGGSRAEREGKCGSGERADG